MSRRALTIAGLALLWAGCGAGEADEPTNRVRPLGAARAEVAISKLQRAEPLPALREARKSQPESQVSVQTPEHEPSQGTPPSQTSPSNAPQKQPPPKSNPPEDEGSDQQLLE